MKLSRIRYFITKVLFFSSLVGYGQNNEVKADSNYKISRIAKPQLYKDIITSKAITDRGLFIVHKVEDRFFFEIPDSILNRDILVVNRISKGAANEYVRQIGYAGDQIGQRVIQFVRGPNYRIFIRTIFYKDVSVDSTENGLYKSVLNSNLMPLHVLSQATED